MTFASRELDEAETNYTQIEREALASKWTLEKFARKVEIHHIF